MRWEILIQGWPDVEYRQQFTVNAWLDTEAFVDRSMSVVQIGGQSLPKGWPGDGSDLETIWYALNEGGAGVRIFDAPDWNTWIEGLEGVTRVNIYASVFMCTRREYERILANNGPTIYKKPYTIADIYRAMDKDINEVRDKHHPDWVSVRHNVGKFVISRASKMEGIIG